MLFVLSLENLSEIRRQHGSNIATHIIENSGLRIKNRLGEGDSIFRSESDELAVLVSRLERPEDAVPLAEADTCRGGHALSQGPA